MTAADTVKDLPLQVKRCPECGTGFGREGAFCPFDGVALTAGTWDPSRDPLTDTIIDNRYEVIAPLGEGGMGTVYKVRHTTLDRLFALKVLRRDLAADAMLAARFLQEARATAAVRHSSVVAINDFGELDDGAPYFVMELLVGETLATRLRARGLLPPREAAGIAIKLADALGAAHAANVVHRDLKPENVFLVGTAAGKSATDEVRIVDFGAAKIMGGSKLTRPGVVFGTPYYMSPEQASGQPVDARADIYSLGVLLYEMITGALPFEADTYMGVLTKHMFAAPVKPSERTPTGVQLGELETIILRALEKDPNARYANMAALSAVIQHAMASRSSEAPAREASRAGRTAAFANAPSTADRIQRSVSRRVEEERVRKRRAIVIAAVSAAVTLSVCALAVSLLDDAKSSKSLLPPPPRVTPAAASTPSPPATAIAIAIAPSSATTATLSAATATVGTDTALTASPTGPAVATTSTAPSNVSATGARPSPVTAPAPPPPVRGLAPGTAPRATSAAPVRPRAPDDLPDPWGR